jgi:gluconolactonase
MKTSFFVFAFLFILAECFAQNIKSDSKIIANDLLIHQVIPKDAQVEILAEGFGWTEGPLWLPTENKLLFSDIPSNSIFEWTEKNGKKLYLKPAGYTGKEKRGGETGSNGLLLGQDGRLIICQHGDRRIARMNASIINPNAEFITLTDNYNGKKLNSPNDAVLSKNGELYFTDPPYGLEKTLMTRPKSWISRAFIRLTKWEKPPC